LDPEEQKVEEEEKDLLAMTDPKEMESLLTRSPMVTTSRTWSPSSKPTTLRLWDHSSESLTETKLKLRLSVTTWISG
jgi:hypothetical protein